MTTGLLALADRIEASGERPTGEEAERVSDAVRAARPDLPVKPEELRSTEDLLHIADRVVPGWSILLRGKAQEPDGHWRCTLRESTSRDSDEFIGDGKGLDLSAAILAAVLRVIDYQVRKSAGG